MGSGYKLENGKHNVDVTLLEERIEKKYEFQLKLGNGEKDTEIKMLSSKRLIKKWPFYAQ